MRGINVVWMRDSGLVGWIGEVEKIQYMVILYGHCGWTTERSVCVCATNILLLHETMRQPFVNPVVL
jgi:hypothetical protein